MDFSPFGMRWGRRRFIPLLLGVLLCIIVSTPSTTSAPLTSLVFPRYWNFKTRFSFVIDITTDVPLDIHILIQTESHGDIVQYFNPGYDCYIELSEHDRLPITKVTHNSGILVMSIGYPDSGPIEMNNSQVICPAAVFNHPEQVSALQEVVSGTVSLKNKEDSQVFMTRTFTKTMTDSYTIQHDYSWGEQNHKNMIASIIAVKFTFYRPPRQSHVTRFVIDHPLLSLSNIQSMHSLSDHHSIDDHYKMYHLISASNYQCANDKGYHSILKHPRNNIHDSPFLTIDIPSSAQDLPYTCSFTIEYPPYVVLAALNSDSRIEIRTPIIDGFQSMFDAVASTALPVNIPNRYITGSTESQLSSRIHLSFSPWNHHRYELGDVITMEFGIAITSYYYDNNGTIKLTTPPDHLYLSISDGFSDNIDLSLFDITYSWIPHLSSGDDGDNIPADPLENAAIDLTHIQRDAPLGMKCRFKIYRNQYRDTQWIDTSLLMVKFYPDQERNAPVQLFVYDSMHHYVKYEDSLVFYHAHSVNANHLPQDLQLQSIPFHRSHHEEEEGGGGSEAEEVTYAIGRFNLQYLPHRPVYVGEANMMLHLLFTNINQLSDMISDTSPFILNISVNSKQFHLIEPLSTREYRYFSEDFTQLVESIDPIESIMKPGSPMRYPSIIVDIPAMLVSTQPVDITIQFAIKSDFHIEDLTIYGVLLPPLHSRTLTYSPAYGLITPLPPPPQPPRDQFTGYSYRCVDWDHMVTAYLHGADPASPHPFPLLDDTNSDACPSLSVTTGSIDVESQMWRKIEYRRYATGLKTCFYELAAVCVTPSSTMAGSYNVHPLTHCQSYLGSIHAIPCELLETPSTTIDSLTSILFGGTRTVNLIPPEQSDSGLISFQMIIPWTYKGDYRHTLTLSVRAVKTSSPPPSDIESTWVVLATDIPAFLSPTQAAPTNTAGLFDLPIFNPEIDQLYVKLTLNYPPYIYQLAELQLPPLFQSDVYNIQQQCSQEDGKIFDPQTQLCVCDKGYMSSIPTGKSNPYLHPSLLQCVSVCGGDFHWAEGIQRCDCPPHEYADMYCKNKIVQPQCHDIPSHIKPPFKTLQCDYGMALDPSACHECTCFSDWYSKDNGKCSNCKLDQYCIPGQTASITFRPEYCPIGRCLCETGYSGDQCEYKVVYGTLHYHQPATDEQLADQTLITATSGFPLILTHRKLSTVKSRLESNIKHSLSGSVHVVVQQGTQVLSTDRTTVITSLVVALAHPSQSSSPSPDQDPFTTTTSTTAFSSMKMMTIQSDSQANGNEFGDLYYAWEQLQGGHQDRPVSLDELYGTLNGIENVYDPHCVPNPYTYCPDGQNNLLPPEDLVDDEDIGFVYEETLSENGNTTTYIIIGVVLGIVLVLFVLMIFAILYCRRHEKACFRNRKAAKGDKARSKTGSNTSHGLELTTASSHSSSSALPPSNTISTSSYLPTQVAVEDPTLPPNWTALQDSNTGKVYYSNKVTMESSWDHPANPKEKPKSAYGW